MGRQVTWRHATTRPTPCQARSLLESDARYPSRPRMVQYLRRPCQANVPPVLYLSRPGSLETLEIINVARSKARTAEEYLAELPSDRREAIATVRQVVLKNLPEGYVETMQNGMIGYVVPLDRYPKTYNGQPLTYAALASQKRHISLYLMNIYGDPEIEQWFVDRYRATGKRLNMGKSCVRFKGLGDIPIDLIGEVIARTTVPQFIERYETSRPKS